MEPIAQSLCVLIVSILSLCGATEYYVRPSEPTNTSCPAQPCLTFNEYASNSESYFTTSNIVFKFLPGTHLVNISIRVRNVHNVSFTSLERKKTPQIIFYKWNQCKNVSCDQLATGICTPFGFWNATSVNIDRLGVLVYPQNKPVYCMHLLGIAFTNVSQLHLHHCNITVLCRTICVYNTYSKTSGLCYSVYLKDSEFARVMFSTITYYQGRLYLLKSKNTEIANSMIVGGITVSDSTIAIIRGCSLCVEAIFVSQCLKCSNKYLALLIPFALAGVVLVLFIKLLDLSVSCGLINWLIFYANIIKTNEHIFLPQGNTNLLTLFISWLNLDLGFEICFFNGLTAYGKAWLQFVFPFYIWVIAGLIIASARYSIRVARFTGYNSVPVLATLSLLSYAKLLRAIITVMSYTIVDYPQGSKAVWSADGNIDYLGPKHAPLFVAALATLLFLWLPYTLLLLLGQWLRRFDNRLLTRMLMKIKPFLDAHYGPLKDKHYYWFGALLFIRIVILLISAVLPANNFSVFTLSISVSAGALVVFTSIGPAVYRSKVTSVFETAIFTNLLLLGLAKFYINAAGGNQAAVTYLLIGVAFSQFIGLVSCRVYSVLKPFFFHYHKRMINNNTDDEDKDDDREREGVWRFETSLHLQEIPRRLATPYENISTALH